MNDGSRAILIGTARYEDGHFPQLPAAANSLAQFRRVLTDRELCGWPDSLVTVHQDPTDVRRLLQDIRRQARNTDRVLLLYFVGHGTLLPDGRLCLALTDTESGDADYTGLEYQRIREALVDSPARTKIVILDCCFSGRAIEALSGSAGDITDIHGSYVLTASDNAAHVVPLERQADTTTSFTGALVELIRAGIPGESEELTLGVLFPHLRNRLARAGRPEPSQHGSDTVHGFRFTRNAAHGAASARPQLTPRAPYSGEMVLPFYLVCEESFALAGPAIEQINNSLSELHFAIGGNPVVADRTRFCLMSFSDTAQVLLPLSDLSTVTSVPGLLASGGTNYSAIMNLLRMTINHDVLALKSDGHHVLRPTVFFLTGGTPYDADEWPAAYRRLVDPRWRAHPNILAFGFGQADPVTVSQVATVRAFICDGTFGPAQVLNEYAHSLITSVVNSGSSGAPGGATIIVPDLQPGFTILPADDIF
ncbi:hypothetical protein GCM10009555_032930 [Acrocarpospora macrocephala]|uniref:Peptidase C14 caspase domain-containing protein n=1 Tax=Acrocarpospora macrocephala TaxID=150177 RepID=A0A5M3WC35_9ACTN|nr:caspase family protein [Acrocarpospora macrocephala]GES06474.1 hypothetical protein Amac_000690 [Acrocarpospora macrocephala]